MHNPQYSYRSDDPHARPTASWNNALSTPSPQGKVKPISPQSSGVWNDDHNGAQAANLEAWQANLAAEYPEAPGRGPREQAFQDSRGNSVQDQHSVSNNHQGYQHQQQPAPWYSSSQPPPPQQDSYSRSLPSVQQGSPYFEQHQHAYYNHEPLPQQYHQPPRPQYHHSQGGPYYTGAESNPNRQPSPAPYESRFAGAGVARIPSASRGSSHLVDDSNSQYHLEGGGDEPLAFYYTSSAPGVFNVVAERAPLAVSGKPSATAAAASGSAQRNGPETSKPHVPETPPRVGALPQALHVVGRDATSPRRQSGKGEGPSNPFHTPGHFKNYVVEVGDSYVSHHDHSHASSVSSTPARSRSAIGYRAANQSRATSPSVHIPYKGGDSRSNSAVQNFITTATLPSAGPGIRPCVDQLKVGYQRRHVAVDERSRALSWLQQARQQEVNAARQKRKLNRYERHADLYPADFPLANGKRPDYHKSHITAVIGAAPMPLRSQHRVAEELKGERKTHVWAKGKQFTIRGQVALPDERYDTPGPGEYVIPSEFE